MFWPIRNVAMLIVLDPGQSQPICSGRSLETCVHLGCGEQRDSEKPERASRDTRTVRLMLSAGRC